MYLADIGRPNSILTWTLFSCLSVTAGRGATKRFPLDFSSNPHLDTNTTVDNGILNQIYAFTDKVAETVEELQQIYQSKNENKQNSRSIIAALLEHITNPSNFNYSSSTADLDNAAISFNDLGSSKAIELRCVLSLLGLRSTAGSVDIFPPTVCHILHSFNQSFRASSGSLLTVGARALSKHFHRDSQAVYWPILQGPESQRNEIAVQTVVKILNNAVWLNVHQLPHNYIAYELRVGEGFGIRLACNAWDGKNLDGNSLEWIFRGFLEPSDAAQGDGHAVGWKH
jgi:hypothetical protein